jgi:hypothetical protein
MGCHGLITSVEPDIHSELEEYAEKYIWVDKGGHQASEHSETNFPDYFYSSSLTSDIRTLLQNASDDAYDDGGYSNWPNDSSTFMFGLENSIQYFLRCFIIRYAQLPNCLLHI